MKTYGQRPADLLELNNMSSRVYSAAIIGLDAQIIEIETEVSGGLRSFVIVGLPDKAVQEARERVGAALKSAGLKSPHSRSGRVLVNLAPADLKKEGSLYDLPIALGYALASKQLRFNPYKKLFVGELSLDGKLRPVNGALSFSLEARDKGFSHIILPYQNAAEASLVKGLQVIGAENLDQVISWLQNKIEILPFEIQKQELFKKVKYPVNLGWIKGQRVGKRALEIAAAGGHNLLMMGPPGTGKTLLAKAICSILPPPTFKEALEITKIYSITGLLPKDKPLINTRPFRSPHHTSSEVALIGGGNPPQPGEITLAHRGVLFLDEFPEFHRDVLESLRQPLEEGWVAILRAKHRLTFPAQFTLICATNPCPCGYYRSPEKSCTCTSSQVQKYRRKLSGPLMDRIDLFIDVPQVRFEKLIKEEQDPTLNIRLKIKKARQIQKQRFKNEKVLTNAEMEIPQIKKYCPVPIASKSLLRQYVNSSKLSARGFHRVLKVARTIADLEGAKEILHDHISQALMFRMQEEE